MRTIDLLNGFPWPPRGRWECTHCGGSLGLDCSQPLSPAPLRFLCLRPGATPYSAASATAFSNGSKGNTRKSGPLLDSLRTDGSSKFSLPPRAHHRCDRIPARQAETNQDQCGIFRFDECVIARGGVTGRRFVRLVGGARRPSLTH